MAVVLFRNLNDGGRIAKYLFFKNQFIESIGREIPSNININDPILLGADFASNGHAELQRGKESAR